MVVCPFLLCEFKVSRLYFGTLICLIASGCSMAHEKWSMSTKYKYNKDGKNCFILFRQMSFGVPIWKYNINSYSQRPTVALNIFWELQLTGVLLIVAAVERNVLRSYAAPNAYRCKHGNSEWHWHNFHIETNGLRTQEIIGGLWK